MNVRRKPPTVVDLADEVAREVDDVRGEVAERARARARRVEAPDLVGRVAPVLEVAAAEVPEVAELAGLDQLPREPDGRDEAVVERAHVLHARGGDAAPDLEALVRVAAERLLAYDVLSRLGGRDRRLRVQVVRAEVVEEADLRVGDELPPVARPALEAVAGRGLPHRLLVPARDRDEPRAERRRPGHVLDLAEGVRVRLAHERVAEQADADLLDVARRSSRAGYYGRS